MQVQLELQDLGNKNQTIIASYFVQTWMQIVPSCYSQKGASSSPHVLKQKA